MSANAQRNQARVRDDAGVTPLAEIEHDGIARLRVGGNDHSAGVAAAPRDRASAREGELRIQINSVATLPVGRGALVDCVEVALGEFNALWRERASQCTAQSQHHLEPRSKGQWRSRLRSRCRCPCQGR